ncbi:MAG TPA: response regulator transcription factor [Microlunatus sp.]|nr:response regulator transcription factor [Microlunatus sp.]
MSEPADGAEGRIRVALVNDYDVVVLGLARILDRYDDRFVIVELDTNESVADHADLVLYDAFAQPESDRFEIGALAADADVSKVVVYTWNLHPELVEEARRQGARGYLSKALAARELVAALEAVHGGETVISESQRRGRAVNGTDWPGRAEGLTDREAEVLALITQGMSNAQISHLTYLSMNTIKSYIRSVYRKIGAGSRTQAVLWGVEHGFRPDHRRIEHWHGGP